jgi:mono/diheme cytochrome c family protein
VASQPPPVSTLAPAATSTPLPPGPDADTLLARGKALFEKDAGGVGCALCHGLDGKGKPELATPSNRGASEQLIWNALETRAQMTFMLGTLSSDDVRAISAYLAELATQP